MITIQFTYEAYKGLISILKEYDYSFVRYINYNQYKKPVIMRHDVDNSLDKAVDLARIEQKEGISSTYFLLLSTDFYNIASKSSLEKIRQIIDCGHEIGLHFDETKYISDDGTKPDIIGAIKSETEIMSKIIGQGIRINAVSMHRPSKETLAADYKIEGMINSYGMEFFTGFKYVSDSRRRWREDIDAIIISGEYDKLHILTHAFWYNEEELDLKTSVERFVLSGNRERYQAMKQNVTDLEEIMGKVDRICKEI